MAESTVQEEPRITFRGRCEKLRGRGKYLQYELGYRIKEHREDLFVRVICSEKTINQPCKKWIPLAEVKAALGKVDSSPFSAKKALGSVWEGRAKAPSNPGFLAAVLLEHKILLRAGNASGPSPRRGRGTLARGKEDAWQGLTRLIKKKKEGLAELTREELSALVGKNATTR